MAEARSATTFKTPKNGRLKDIDSETSASWSAIVIALLRNTLRTYHKTRYVVAI